MKHKSRSLGTIAAAGLLVVATACAGGNNSAAEGGAGDEVIIAFNSEVDTLDPHQFKSVAAYGVGGNVYGTLLQEGYSDPEDGVLEYTGEATPYLAKSATWNNDRTVLTFDLRDGVEFASGEPVTAEDVVWSLQRALSDVGYVAAVGSWLNIPDPSTGIVAVDDKTVELRVTHYSPLIEQFLAFQIFAILDKSVIEENSAEGDPWGAEYLAANATASGPYTGDEQVTGKSTTLTKNDSFNSSDLADAPNRVVLQNMPDPQQAFLALQNGAVDLVYGLTPDIAEAVEMDDNLRLYSLEYSDIVYVGFNNQDPALKDARVRQALSYLMPYDALRTEVMKGYAGTAYGAVPYPMGDSLDETGEKIAYPTDVDKAKDLLEEAGIEEGELSLTLSVPVGEVSLRQSAVFIQSALDEAGVTVEINELSEADFNSNLGKMQMYIDSWYSWGQDSVYQMFFLLTSGLFTNYTNYSNPEVDDLVKRAMETTDPDERHRLSQEAQKIIIDDAPWAFLYTRDVLVGAQSNLEGITHSNDANLRFDRLRVTD